MTTDPSDKHPVPPGRFGALMSSAKKWIDGNANTDTDSRTDRSLLPAQPSELQTENVAKTLSFNTPAGAVTPPVTSNTDTCSNASSTAVSDNQTHKQMWETSLDDDTLEAHIMLSEDKQEQIQAKVNKLVSVPSSTVTKIIGFATRLIDKETRPSAPPSAPLAPIPAIPEDAIMPKALLGKDRQVWHLH